jgi:cytochrome c oxidase subunit 2
MEFLVIAQSQDDFAAWLELQRQPAPEPVDALSREGQQIFLGSACVYCHAVRGTPASGRLGPDLTHLASRRTLGARMIENNRGNLAGWTVNAQAIKPGNKMPPMYMEPEALHALLAYLELLE